MSIEMEKKTFLKPFEKPSAKSISVRLPADLHERFEKLKERAEAKGLTISITEIVTEAVRTVCDYDEQKLENMEMEADLKAGHENARK